MSDTWQDQLEIEKAMYRYAMGVDEHRWEGWDLVFAPGASIDFTPMGGERLSPTELRERMSRPDPDRLFGQHPLCNTIIEVDGDRATAFSQYLMELGRRSDTEGEIIRMSGGGTYEDTLVRTETGWRFSGRRVSLKWKETRQVKDEVVRR